MNKVHSASIDALNSLLKQEISAVQSYKQAITKLNDGQPIATFEELQVAHARRAQRLRKRVEQLGGIPKESSGTWGAFSKAVTAAGALLGPRPAVAALEEGEDRGLADYKSCLNKLDEQSRTIILTELLPGQEWTRSVMRTMKKLLNC